MYGNILGGANVLGATTTATAAVVLPNTGDNRTMAIVATITLVVGVAILASSFARFLTKKFYKG